MNLQELMFKCAMSSSQYSFYQGLPFVYSLRHLIFIQSLDQVGLTMSIYLIKPEVVDSKLEQRAGEGEMTRLKNRAEQTQDTQTRMHL